MNERQQNGRSLDESQLKDSNTAIKKNNEQYRVNQRNDAKVLDEPNAN